LRDYKSHDLHEKSLTWNEAYNLALWTCESSREFKLPLDWMINKFTAENHWHALGTDGTGSWAIPQITVPTAQQEADELGLKIKVTKELLQTDSRLAIRLACSYFRRLLNSFKNDRINATRYYNAGEKSKTDECAGLPHVYKVMGYYLKYEKFKKGEVK
jgi:hypothetical protein